MGKKNLIIWGKKKIGSIHCLTLSIMLRLFYKTLRKETRIIPSNHSFFRKQHLQNKQEKNFILGCSECWGCYPRLEKYWREVLSALPDEIKLPVQCVQNFFVLHLAKGSATDKQQKRFVNAALLAAKIRSLHAGRLNNCQPVINGWLSPRIYCQWGEKGERCEQK